MKTLEKKPVVKDKKIMDRVKKRLESEKQHKKGVVSDSFVSHSNHYSHVAH